MPVAESTRAFALTATTYRMSDNPQPAIMYRKVTDPFDGTVKVYQYDEQKSCWYLYSVFMSEAHSERHLTFLTSRGGRVPTAGRG